MEGVTTEWWCVKGSTWGDAKVYLSHRTWWHDIVLVMCMTVCWCADEIVSTCRHSKPTICTSTNWHHSIIKLIRWRAVAERILLIRLNAMCWWHREPELSPTLGCNVGTDQPHQHIQTTFDDFGKDLNSFDGKDVMSLFNIFVILLNCVNWKRLRSTLQYLLCATLVRDSSRTDCDNRPNSLNRGGMAMWVVKLWLLCSLALLLSAKKLQPRTHTFWVKNPKC
jgi:hypothetical protein